MKKQIFIVAIFFMIGMAVPAQSNFSSSIAGEALNLDGVNDYIVCPIAVSSFSSGVFTLEAWAKSSSNSSYTSIIKNWGHTLNGAFHLGTTLIGDKFEIYLTQSNGTTIFATDPATIALGTWYHIAAVADGTNLRLYKNGIQVASTSYNGTLLTNFPYTFIGAKPNDTGTAPSSPEAGHWNGILDELRIWNRPLCQGEIQNNMNGEIATTASSLLANYHFNQGVASSSNPTITSLNDATGNLNTGLLTNFALVGSTSNWIAPGGVVSGSLVPAFVSPTVTIFGSNAICNGATTTFTASGNVITYTWTSGPNNSLYTISPTITTTYSVSGTNTAGCLSNIATKTLSVNPLPVVSVNNGVICYGNSFTITPSGASTYTISGGSSVVTPTANTSYNITGTSSFGCVSSNTAVSSVTVNALPTVSVNSGVICSGDSFTIAPSGTADTYSYSSGGSIVTPTANTLYTVTGTSTVTSCTNTAITAVTVNALPTINAVSNASVLCVGQSASLSANGTITYTWNTNATTSVIFVSPSVTTTYSVTGTDINGCSNSTTITQSVTACTSLFTIKGKEIQVIAIYPNPNRGEFMLDISVSGQYLIVNGLGELVQKIEGVAGLQKIDMFNLPKGIYYLVGENIRSKFLIE
ncbi:MAG: hypothetical protein JNJ41_13465 [Bacteroidia bacterium]|nr:hypothetical protein [Bacteroidia bacterium]